MFTKYHQKHHQGTPDPVVFFLSGTLPGQAIFHLHQLSLFSMITRLPGSDLFQHALHVLTCSKSSSKSWFLQIRDISLQYHLPHPLILLQTPLNKEQFKRLVKAKIQDYWQVKLRNEAGFLSSLGFFKPQFMSLSKPHPLWLSARSNPYESTKAVVRGSL